MSLFAPPGFDPPGYVPAGFGPAGLVLTLIPFDPADLDVDLVKYVAGRVGIAPSPLMVAPGAQKPVTITYTFLAETPAVRLSGASGLAHRLYQIDFRSTDPAAISQASEKFRASIQGFRGTFGTNQVRGATYKRIPTTYTDAANKSPSGTLRIAAELGIWFRQTIPEF